MKQRFGLTRLLVAFVEALLIALALAFLAEYFGWQLFREAGGESVVSAFGLPGR